MLQLPFKGLYKLTQEFGVNPDLYKQFLVLFPDGLRHPMKGHNGLDFGCPDGTEVIAPHDGEVLEATLDQTGYGWYVKIENDEEGSVLAHLMKIDVQIGFKLKAGDHIGLSDNSGNSTASHLHWGYYTKPRDRANGLAGFIDQTPLLIAEGYVVKLFELPVKNDISQPVEASHVYTKTEYDACMNDRQKFWNERDAAIKQVESVKTELQDVKSMYSAFQAMGYNSIDDVTKALDKKDNDMVGVKQQLIAALDRNTKLADLLSQKDHEDSTAIEDGLNALEELKNLKNNFAEVTKEVGAEKPELNHIISKIGFIKDLAEKFIRIKESEHQAQQQKEEVKAPVQQQSFSKILLGMFDL